MGRSSKFSAADSALGYLFQCRLALYESLRRIKSRTADAVCLETLDDVHFEEGGEPKELLQAKHKCTEGDVSDMSTDLWQSIRIWIENKKLGSYHFEDLQHLIITTARAKDGSALSLLGVTGRNTTKALDLLSEAAAKTTNKTNMPGADLFKDLNGQEQTELVESITIISDSPDILGILDLIKPELSLTVRDEHVEYFLTLLEGWWFQTCIEHLSDKNASPISFKSLQAQVFHLADQFQEDNLPVDLRDDTQWDFGEEETRTFVLQLRLIGLTNDAIEVAIRNYYRAFANRSQWNREDLLLVGELASYESKLIDEWKQLFTLMRSDITDLGDDVESSQKGFELYKSLSYDKHIPLRPKIVEESVYRGTLHILADARSIGWHHSFEDRLAELIEVAAQ